MKAASQGQQHAMLLVRRRSCKGSRYGRTRGRRPYSGWNHRFACGAYHGSLHRLPRTDRRLWTLEIHVRGLLLIGFLAAPPPASAQPEPPSSPNIVVIVTDDQLEPVRTDADRAPGAQGAGTLACLSHREQSAKGPSRASLLTGTYQHTNGVWSNGAGGVPRWDAFRPLEDETLATWLEAAGYRTGLFGKYVNQYPTRRGLPPGWDWWVAFAERNGAYFGYDLTVDGEVVRFGDAPEDHSTDVLGGYVESFVRGSDPAHRCSLLRAVRPTRPGNPAPRHERADVRTCPITRGSTNATSRTSPRGSGSCSLLDRARLDRLRDRARRQARTLTGGRGRRADPHGDAGDGRTDTLYVLVADQGIAWGEHRWTFKGDPYEPSIREALVLRWDGHIACWRAVEGLVQNLDVAPTLAEVAGAGLGGRSPFASCSTAMADSARTPSPSTGDCPE